MTLRPMNILYMLLVLLAAVSSCVKESPVKVNFYDDAYVDAGIADYPAKAMVFRAGECVSITDIDKLSTFSTIEAKDGDIIRVLACPDFDEFILSPSAPGSPSEAYYFQTTDSRTYNSGLWVAQMNVSKKDKSFKAGFKRISSKVSVIVVNPPAGFDNVHLTIEDCTNTYYVLSDSLTSEIVQSPCVVMPRPESKTVTVLPPMKSEGCWTPTLKLTVDKKTFFPQLELEQGLEAGLDVTITVDLSAYPEDGSYSVKGELTNASDGSVRTSVRKRFSTTQSSGLYSDQYSLAVYEGGGWSEADVFEALCSDASKHSRIWNDWENSKALRDTMSYCVVENDFAAPLRVRVRKLNGTFSKCEIRPSTYGIEPTIVDSHTVEFELPFDKRKVSVEFDGDRFHNLFIYANKPYAQKPSASDPSVQYYGPGFHNPGTIRLSEGQTLFVDYGAVVYANVITTGSNVSILGNGIISGQKMKHWGDDQYSWGDFLVNSNNTTARAANFTMKDVTLIDGPGWNVIVKTTDGVIIDGVNTISWELNGDGIDICSCTGVDISNCFLRNYDDNITLKVRFIINPMTDVSDVHIHDCLIWNDYARGIVVGPEAGSLSSGAYLHDIEVRDCIFLEHGNGGTNDLRAAFAIGQGSKGDTNLWSGTDYPASIMRVSARNLVFDNLTKNGRAVAIWQYKGQDRSVSMSDITFESFTILDANSGTYPALYIKTNGSTISGLKIKGLTVDGAPITSTGDEFVIDTPSNVNYTIE